MNTANAIPRVLGFELTRIRASPVAVLALTFAALFFIGVGSYVARYAEWINRIAQMSPEDAQDSPAILLAALLARWIGSSAHPTTRALFEQNSPVLATFFYISLSGVPWLAMLIASDQTASDLGRRHIRFLLPRVTRRSLFVARALSAWFAWVLMSVACLIGAGAVLTAVSPDQAVGPNAVFTARMVFAYAVYGLPFVAFMSFVNTFLPNAFLGYLVGGAAWFILGFVSWVGEWSNSPLMYLTYLTPAPAALPLIDPDPTKIATGVGLALAYTVVFVVLGDLIFRKRDM